MLSTKNMRKFDTRTQYFRYEVLREVARWHTARRNPGYSNEDYSGQEANDALLRIQGTRDRE